MPIETKLRRIRDNREREKEPLRSAPHQNINWIQNQL